MSLETIAEQVEEVINQNERFRSSYFWSPPRNAASRRSYESRESIEEFEFKFDGREYSLEFTVDCSCKNIYVYRKFFWRKSGEEFWKKTTITRIKNVLKKMKTILEHPNRVEFTDSEHPEDNFASTISED